MSLMTNWGYTLTALDALPDMLGVSDFNNFTANKYASDIRTEANIKAAGTAIRNYCGWHVFPSETCKIETTFYDKRVTEVFGGILIQLPASYVSKVTSITIGEKEHTSFVLEPNGILRLYDVNWYGLYKHTPIVVEYEAGLPEDLMDALKELIAHRVVHALSSTAGVQSETAGGVSITYNATWANSTRATALADDNLQVLQPYRVRGVF